MITCKAWKGDDLRGEWRVYRKLDGVRALTHPEWAEKYLRSIGAKQSSLVWSRRGKPLYNLDRYAARFTDAEVWLGSFKATIQAVRTSTAAVTIPRSAIYQLDPPDKRLYLGTMTDPTAVMIRDRLKRFKQSGEDGLVLRNVVPRHLARRGVQETWLKVKHVETYDVKVIDVQPGKGRHKGKRIGALLTPMGKVGGGLSDKDRRRFYMRVAKADRIIGKTIEVACSRLTPGGKFRHARFVRVREDK